MPNPPSLLLRAVWSFAGATLLLGGCGTEAGEDDDGAYDTSAAAATMATDAARSSAERSETAVTGDAELGPTTVGAGELELDGAGMCGWGPTGETPVRSGYVLGGDGEDPSGLMPMACPTGVALVAGGACGGAMGITGVGCCDAAGAVWFCADDGRGPTLFTDHR